MSALRDKGWAKVNLTLEVLGRRPDGFHELKSLVAFAALGDELTLDPGEELGLEIDGPFARALAGDNLIIRAANAALDRVPKLRLGRFGLIKLLPVAAGLGGGSADAAAALRLIARANPGGVAEPSSPKLSPRSARMSAYVLRAGPRSSPGAARRFSRRAASRLSACCSPI